jgi:hypothetical protein
MPVFGRRDHRRSTMIAIRISKPVDPDPPDTA